MTFLRGVGQLEFLRLALRRRTCFVVMTVSASSGFLPAKRNTWRRRALLSPGLLRFRGRLPERGRRSLHSGGLRGLRSLLPGCGRGSGRRLFFDTLPTCREDCERECCCNEWL